jgi:hypothetical protein
MKAAKHQAPAIKRMGNRFDLHGSPIERHNFFFFNSYLIFKICAMFYQIEPWDSNTAKTYIL